MLLWCFFNCLDECKKCSSNEVQVTVSIKVQAVLTAKYLLMLMNEGSAFQEEEKNSCILNNELEIVNNLMESW